MLRKTIPRTQGKSRIDNQNRIYFTRRLLVGLVGAVVACCSMFMTMPETDCVPLKQAREADEMTSRSLFPLDDVAVLFPLFYCSRETERRRRRRRRRKKLFLSCVGRLLPFFSSSASASSFSSSLFIRDCPARTRQTVCQGKRRVREFALAFNPLFIWDAQKNGIESASK